MAIKINGKVLRNIPEQVSKNMSDIKWLITELQNKEYTIQDIQIVAGHLIITTYAGEQIDAGEVKTVVSMHIDASQHLIVTYNTGATEDLGAIFSGNITISGDLAVTGDASISGDLQAETLEQTQANVSVDFSSAVPTTINPDLTYVAKYCRFEVLNNILYIVWNFELRNDTASNKLVNWTRMPVTIPTALASKIYDFDNRTVAQDGLGMSIMGFSIFHGSENTTRTDQSASARLVSYAQAKPPVAARSHALPRLDLGDHAPANAHRGGDSLL